MKLGDGSAQKNTVSIVVPVYNTSQYLERCITSIVQQTYPDLEILLLDDGSTDTSPQICDAWAERDPRIRVIHKQNEGSGKTRNTGIDLSTGKYLCFFDSDDYVARDLIEKARNKIEAEKADVVLYGYASVSANLESVCACVPAPEKECYQGAEVQSLLLPELLSEDPETGRSANLTAGACAAMYSADLINRAKWRFVSEREIISEDVYFSLALYKHVRKAVVLKEALYFYCENEKSLTHTYRPDRFEKVKYFYKKCVELCRESQYPPEVARRCREPFISFTIAALKHEVVFAPGLRAAYRNIRRIVNDELLQQVLAEKKADQTNWKKKTLFWAMRKRFYPLVFALLAVQNAVK